jgi:hypothetical protein
VTAPGSRYAGLAPIVEPDARRPGRTIVRRPPRPLPDVTGTFTHVLTDGQRLDHLATLYYREPRRWWRICDANPDQLSPLDLVGRGAGATVRIPLAQPLPGALELADVAAALRADVGVLGVGFVPDPPAVTITYNKHSTTATALLGHLHGLGDGVVGGPATELGAAGRRITIPPDVR